MKNRAISLLATTVVVASLTACAGTADPAETDAGSEVTGTLTVLIPADTEAGLAPIVEEFNSKYPDANVEVEYVGGDYPAILSARLQAGTETDIIGVYPGGIVTDTTGLNVLPIADQGYIADISESPWVADIPEQWTGKVQLEGVTYAYPTTTSGLGMIYNLTALDEVGLSIPTTWDELLQFCADAEANDRIALAQGFTDGSQMVFLALTSTLLYGQEPDFDAQMLAGETSFTDPRWIEAYTKAAELNDAGCYGEGSLGRARTQGTDLVASGEALAAMDGTWALSAMIAAAPDSQFQINTVPATNNADESRLIALPGMTMAVSAEAKNPVAALAFIELVHENRGAYALAAGGVPLIPDPSFEAPEELSAFSEASAAGKVTDLPSAITGALQDLMMQELQAVLLGTRTAEDALANIQVALEAR